MVIVLASVRVSVMLVPSANLTSFFSANYLLSFGKTRNDVLGAFTNEDPINLNNIVLF